MATSLAQKLQLKPDRSLVVLNAPQGYTEVLETQLEGISVSTKTTGKAEAALVFVNSLAEAEKLAPRGIRLVGADGLLWLAYPKGSSKIKTDVNRDRLWDAVKPTGWCPVRQVALDDTWSAMRFRPEEKVGR